MRPRDCCRTDIHARQRHSELTGIETRGSSSERIGLRATYRVALSCFQQKMKRRCEFRSTLGFSAKALLV
ncbi:MAG: hypothetical protein JWM11_4957 [Planctomycetaceae bacterium]|nr:hypothetical protein [Planctomycetaceae bacterium]